MARQERAGTIVFLDDFYVLVSIRQTYRHESELINRIEAIHQLIRLFFK